MSAMQLRRNSRIVVPALLALATVVVALNAWLAFRTVDALLQNELWVQHTYQVIGQVDVIISVVSEAGPGLRGYLVTDDPRYLEPYLRAQQRLPGLMDDLASLTGDNPSQRVRVAQVQQIVGRRMDLLNNRLRSGRAGDKDVFGLPFITETKITMDQLRAMSDSMKAEEKQLLAHRIEVAHRSSVRTRFSIGLASGLDFLLIVLMFQYFVHERTLRLETEQIAERLDVARADAEASAASLSELNATLEERVRQRTSELEATNRELEAFSYSVSHDLRAPLRTIDGFSLALEEDFAESIDQTGKDYIRRVRAGVQRMGQLIDALLQLSRITRAELSRQDVDVSALAGVVATALQEEAEGRTPTFHIEAGLRTDADAKLLQVALENLMGNAVKFSSKVEHPSIAFGWDTRNDAYFIRDNGAGFDMQYADRLFSAFNRLHGDKDFKGSGIGLATVARVVRRHGGSIWTESAVNYGATFWFTLR